MSQTNIAAVYYYAKLGQIVVSLHLCIQIISYMYVILGCFRKKSHQMELFCSFKGLQAYVMIYIPERLGNCTVTKSTTTHWQGLP